MEMPAVNQVEVRTSLLAEKPNVSRNLVQLHPLCQQKPIVEYCKKHDILVEAYTPLIRGKWDEPAFKEIADKVPSSMIPPFVPLLNVVPAQQRYCPDPYPLVIAKRVSHLVR